VASESLHKILRGNPAAIRDAQKVCARLLLLTRSVVLELVSENSLSYIGLNRGLLNHSPFHFARVRRARGADENQEKG
jgi:hypothetical protein